MIRKSIGVAAFFLLLGMMLLSRAFGQTNGNDDPLLQAMRTELERSKAQLKLEQMGAPYYIDYHATEIYEYRAEAAFGALRMNLHSHTRFLRVMVRVGDYKQDSVFEKGGQGVSDFLSLDNDVLTLRRQLWVATDRAYKAALEALAEKKAQLKQYTIQPVDDFVQAQPVQMIGPLVKLEVSPQPWIKVIKGVSHLYKTDTDLQYLGAVLSFSAVNRYFVNSEGTVTRYGQTFYEMGFSTTCQAADGKRLDRSHSYTVTNIKELPTEREIIAEAARRIGTLKDLRAAPIVDEDYHGPVLFSADAAADVVADLVGENVLGRRPHLGQTARTTGAWSTNYKARVLPEFLTVVDDPTTSSIQGQPLLGAYPVDDEGVKPARVSVIESGKLLNYVLGREPIRDFPESNGHGRARVPGNSPGPSLGNLIVRSAQPVPAKELKEKLISLCRERDLPYGYVETLGPSRVPRLIYKVWVKDGHEQLVRGAVFGALDTRAMRDNLIAAGDDLFVRSRTLNIPHSVVSPSILFDELEVKRGDIKNEKLPEYSAPAPTL